MIVTEEEQRIIAAAYGVEIHHIYENDNDAMGSIERIADTIIDWAKEKEGQYSVADDEFSGLGTRIRDQVLEVRDVFGYSSDAIIYILQQFINFKRLAILAQED